jgi:hypothetical protein
MCLPRLPILAPNSRRWPRSIQANNFERHISGISTGNASYA